MDTFSANKLTKKKPCKKGETKCSAKSIVKTHKAYVKKQLVKDTKPDCIFCNYKKPKK